MLNYEIALDDPKTFTAPVTLRVPLTTSPGFQVLPYECHEGNQALAQHPQRRTRRRQGGGRGAGEGPAAAKIDVARWRGPGRAGSIASASRYRAASSRFRCSHQRLMTV